MQNIKRSSKSMISEFTKQYLLISLIPIFLFLIFLISGGYSTQKYIVSLLKNSTHDLNSDAKEELEKLGQHIIKTKARFTARQVAQFLSYNPEIEMRILQQSDEFKAIAKHFKRNHRSRIANDYLRHEI